MFDTICGFIPLDPDYPERTRQIEVLKRVLDGSLYDALPYEFHEERGPGGEYIPLRKRRPSVRYPLARIVVDDSLSLVFSEGHFPTIECDDAGIRSTFADIVAESGLNQVMMEAALRGSVGSVAVLLRLLKGRIFFRVVETTYLTPTWDPEEPDRLLSITERYKVPGVSLLQQGYPISDAQADYWFMRQWDAEDEIWFRPWPVSSDETPKKDEIRSVHHGLGFVPITWIRNLPGGSAGAEGVDGGCTFRSAVETSIEIDYQLSQAGRGLKYSSDPTLLIREPAASDGEIIRGGGNALVVSEKGDAKLLEIGGTAASAVIDYVRTLREYALEGVHGNRAAADRLTASQSGRAMEMMNQGLMWLADNLRVSYGAGLLQLASMIVRASHRYRIVVRGEAVGALDSRARLSLRWPRWYAPTSDDKQRDALTLKTLFDAGQISRETAVKSIADVYEITDVPAKLARIAMDQALGHIE